MSDPAAPAVEGPTLQLVRGDAAPEELAALVAVLSARRRGPTGPPAPVPQHGRWGDPAATMRRRLDPGPGAWRASGRIT